MKHNETENQQVRADKKNTTPVLRIRIRDPVPFLTPGSGIRDE